MIGIIQFLPPDSWNVSGTDNVGTPNFLKVGKALMKDMKTKMETGPKSFTNVRIRWFRNLLLSKAVTCIVDQKVVSAIASATKGVVRFIGSACAKFLRKEARAS